MGSQGEIWARKQSSSSKRDNKKIGNSGEEIAARYLDNIGYHILERNYRSRIGELDIVAEYGGIIVIVEVKTRKNQQFGRPAEAVNYNKQRKIVKTTMLYLKYSGKENRQVRFDVIEILGGIGSSYSINHIKNAFEVG